MTPYIEGHRMPQVGDIYQSVTRQEQQLVIAVEEGLVILGDGVAHLFTELINPQEWRLLQPAAKQVVVPHGAVPTRTLSETIQKGDLLQ